ncbi:TonB-dependent receptor [Ferrimonas aestuarii]|uniref:TonB-dependent receptor n=1 Tax=Ferrimonas aestuarii TaxID=2569539 RepID=A0A4U1BRD7_9GAMM|nr:TonB-dependent receptor plug domain-containing protein [Ferrimonas aestuarii]TKB57627.1 TonB-dependent receptor [Ferrimonas aestuarii]
MNNKNLRVHSKRTLAAIAVSTLLATTPVQASSTSGSIYGQAEAGSAVSFTNKDTGLNRTVTAGDNGRFNFKEVPPGRYVVTSANGEKHEVVVKIGTGSSVIFGSNDVEVITVQGGRISAIDTTSTESTVVFTQDQIELLPVSRDVTSVALLTPGTQKGVAEFGNLASFGGSSVAENGYYIDGMDVTNLKNFLSFASLPFDAIEQTQVKTGGYGVEYGRALGGITNVITKSGTNEWEFSAAAYYIPESLYEDEKDVVDRAHDDGTLLKYDSDNTYNSLAMNVGVGGPLIKDTLFLYANLEGQYVERDWYYRSTSTNQEITNPNYLVKLDYYLNDNHLFKLTYINNESDREQKRYENAAGEYYTGSHGTKTTDVTYENGGDILIANYSGQITDDLSVSLMYGTLDQKDENRSPRNLPGGECVVAIDTSGDKTWSTRENIGCWNPANSSSLDPESPSEHDERDSYKFDFDWTIGDHTIRGGYNKEEYTSYAIGSQYSGGLYYRYMDGNTLNEGILNGVDIGVGTKAVRIRTSDILSGAYGVENEAFYLEDNWQITDNILVYAGIRNETFTNLDAKGDVFVEADDLWAPRFGFSWDINGDSTQKLYATAGRYYIPIASNTNIRSTRTESFTEKFYFVDGFNPEDGTPINLGEQFGREIIDNQTPDPRNIAVSDLDPMYQDEFILGYQHALDEDWTVGIKGMYREVKDGMDDFCAHDGFIKWAEDNGYDNFDYHTMSGCLIVNPGKDLSLYMDLENDGNMTHVTVPNSYFELPEYERTYKGIELTLERAFNDDWYMNASYVWSKSEGNVEGYVNSTLGQEDAGATQDFDHKLFQDGSDGYLPNDRRHQFKIYGLYQVTDEIAITANISAASGTPLSCNGYIPLDGMTEADQNSFSRYSASSFYCVNDQGEPELTNRGDYGETDWTYNVDMGINYVPAWADDRLTLKMDVFNLFNFDEAIEYNQQKDLERGSPVQNPNFLAPTEFQSPRYFRFTARYVF